MFKLKGFFASSSNFVKFLVALLVPLFFLCFTSAVLAVVLKVTGVEEASVGAELAVQFVSSIITFILGGGLAAYLIFDEPKEELKLSSAGKGKNYLYGIIALLAIQPIVGVVNEWNQAISLPDFLAQLLFRGVLQNHLAKWFKNVHVAVWVSAIIFSAIHFQFYGFFPRMILGAALGYLLVYGKSLWLPIAAHCFNNFMAVVAAWSLNKFEVIQNVEAVAPTYTTSEDYIFLIGCVFVVGLSYYKLYFTNKD